MEEEIFYIDGEYNLLNQEGNILCNLRDNTSAYGVNLVDNTVYKDGIKIGVVDDINSLNRSSMLDTKVRKLVPEDKKNNFGIGKISIMGLILGLGLLFIVYLIVR